MTRNGDGKEKYRDLHQEQSATEVNRRRFLAYTAGLTPIVPSLLGDRADAAAEPAPVQKPARVRRTLFFNFSHETDHATAAYFLVAGKHRYNLRRLGSNDATLARERENNRFLQGVPDASLTHVLENVALPADAVVLCYTVKNPDTKAGTWSLSSLYTHLPESGVAYAYQLGRTRVTEGSLPLSAKRRLYGHRAAESMQDVLDERALADVTDHASTLIGMHPNMLSGEPNSAAHIHTNWIQPNGATTALAVQIQALGDAQPEQSPGAPNPAGWATLVPLIADNGEPFKNHKGNNKGLIQYTPDWHPAIDAIAGNAATTIAPQVNNDEILGTDITGSDGQSMTVASMGQMWARHDGFTTVDQSSTASGAEDPGTVKWTLNDKSVDQGFLVTANVKQQGDSVQVTLTAANWYLRWIGVWLQFLDNQQPPQVIPVSQLPPNTIPGGNPDSSTTNELFGAMVPPEFTILAIPVAAGYSTLTFNMPPNASTVRILGSGLGTGSVDYPDTVVLGSVMTIAMNFGLTTFFLAAGASDKFSPFQKLVVLPIASLFGNELATLLAADLKSSGGISDPATWKSMGLTLLKAVLNLTGRESLRVVVAGIIAIVTASEFEDAIPIAGQILRAIAAIVGVADLAHTFVDVLQSPWSYVYEMVFTHDLSFNIRHATDNDKFPETANYYKVTALFDNGGTPHTQTLSLPNGTVSTLPPVVFKNVPLGGQVNLSTAFYSRSTDPAQNDWLAGKGTTGLVSNSVDQAPDLTIEQYKVPIKSGTVYVHKQKTGLQADGTHIWIPTATPPSATQASIACEGVGTLCDFRNITVRQGTSKQTGYVGYAWKAYSNGLSGCGSGGQGQFDQMANLNTGQNPQTGYANGPCGLPDGVRLAYNPLIQSSSNFYLDSAAQIVRQVQLDPPSFDPPSEKRAWGKLNLTSTALLLHPTGKLVSINSTESRIETLRIPSMPMTDSDAGMRLLAQVHAGPGSRPGLVSAPAAAAISPDGVVLLLEQNNNRIQAFDTGANPVQFFTKQQRPYFLNLDATADGGIYLDLAVEFTGYLYVLSYNQGSNLYRLDIYHPGQSGTAPLSTTKNFNAAKLIVDFWRNVYTLNYEVLQLPDGNYPSVTEPSVSLWSPSLSDQS
jgi:hypothetical protein